MRKVLHIILIQGLIAGILSNCSYGQVDTSFRLINTYTYDISSFAVNNLNELYVINSANQLKKFNQKGDSVGVFNEVTKYGELSYVQTQNPWRTILFYKKFSTIVLLDKYLNVLTNINLRKHNIFRVQTVTSSYDNNLWLFDEQDSKLKKLDDSGNLLLETVDLRIIFDSVPSPTTIIDHNGFVYLYDTQKGLYIFDHYGTFKNKITFLHWKDLEVSGKFIYGFDDNKFYRYSIGTLKLEEFALPAAFKNYTSLKVINGNLYLLKTNRLNIYSIN